MTANIIPGLLLTMTVAILTAIPAGSAAAGVDLTRATVRVRDDADAPERIAATVLVEEVEKRTGIRWTVTHKSSPGDPVVAIWAGPPSASMPVNVREAAATIEAEGYAVVTSVPAEADLGFAVWIVGADKRGALYGVGHVLRNLDMRAGSVNEVGSFDTVSAPEYPIRGHQLGYRATANSYDAWDAAQYDQYIRELALFGANCIENIPFQDVRPTAADNPRREMNKQMSVICDRYGIDYWIWTPADFDLNDTKRRPEALAAHEQLYRECPRLDAVFFPGGDPGNNPPELVMPFLEDIAAILAKYHPKAKVWISLQGFEDPQVDVFYDWVEAHMPDWMGGVVAGPSSPSIRETRLRLPEPYGVRHYPDITHVVRCQYPVPWIDPAIAFTLGREPVNPRPVYYRTIHNKFAPYTKGFLTYSDGIHDDLNKTVWSVLGWDTRADLRTILVEYCRFFFGQDVAERSADGIFALERNWDGPLAQNGSVDGTLLLWQNLEAEAPALAGNWRWQTYLIRAYYDAYVRHRLLNESALEAEANTFLLNDAMNATGAGEEALAVLAKADRKDVRPELRARIVDLCQDLFESIGFQTSVDKYGASGPERGAVLDYVDYPLNNRWWMEDEIAKALELGTEMEKRERLKVIASWEDPGPGGFYDDIGNVAKCPNVVRGEQTNTLLEVENAPIPDFMWWDAGMRRVRQSWVSKMDWPRGIRYSGLDPDASYVLRTTGCSDCLPRVNGVRLAPTLDGKEVGELKEFPIPKRLIRDSTILVTFDVPFEPGVNWRYTSRLSEVWLVKR